MQMLWGELVRIEEEEGEDGPVGALWRMMARNTMISREVCAELSWDGEEVVEMDDAPRDSPSAREWASSPMTVLIAAVLPDPTRGDDPTRRYLPELGSSQS